MARLLISYHNLKHEPGAAGGHDGYRWHVGVKHSEDEDEQILLVVEVSRSAAAQIGLSKAELDSRVEDALQNYAVARLTNDRPAGEQVLGWNGPIVVGPDHFT